MEQEIDSMSVARGVFISYSYQSRTNAQKEKEAFSKYVKGKQKKKHTSILYVANKIKYSCDVRLAE